MLRPDAPIQDPQCGDAVSLGTTILAVSFDGGVVLAADSRTSSGSLVVNRVANKLTKLTEHIFCCRSGSAADTQALAEMAHNYLLRHELDIGRPATVATAANLFQELCYSNRWNVQAGIIVGGWDSINGGTVYNIPLGGSCIKLSYAMGGSGSTYLYAWADANFRTGMTKEQCLNFVREAVSHAMARDGSSGGVIRTIVLDANGSEHQTIPWPSIPYAMEKDPQFAELAPQNCAVTSTSVTPKNQMDSTAAEKK